MYQQRLAILGRFAENLLSGVSRPYPPAHPRRNSVIVQHDRVGRTEEGEKPLQVSENPSGLLSIGAAAVSKVTQAAGTGLQEHICGPTRGSMRGLTTGLKTFSQGVGVAKNITFHLLETWRNLRLTAGQTQRLLAIHPRICFDTS